MFQKIVSLKVKKIKAELKIQIRMKYAQEKIAISYKWIYYCRLLISSPIEKIQLLPTKIRTFLDTLFKNSSGNRWSRSKIEKLKWILNPKNPLSSVFMKSSISINLELWNSNKIQWLTDRGLWMEIPSVHYTFFIKALKI